MIHSIYTFSSKVLFSHSLGWMFHVDTIFNNSHNVKNVTKTSPYCIQVDIQSFLEARICLFKTLALKPNVLHIKRIHVYLQGVPKKMLFKPIFEFLTLGGVVSGVKNNSKNFGNTNNIRLFSKILSKWALFQSKFLNYLDFV